ncbi:MAG: hypothetical protein WC768_01755 [Patescibacteria group bacterium]|jgi:hypothetical protein
MNSKNSPKALELNKNQELPLAPDRFPAAKKTPEIQEGLSQEEKEGLRAEVLKELTEAEKPKPKPVPLGAVKPTEIDSAGKTQVLLEIENILEEDLADLYFQLDPKTQEKFKSEGELAAAKIEKVLGETKVKVKMIFRIIFEWLKVIPGVNKFFLRQEAKIKTDKIMKLKS